MSTQPAMRTEPVSDPLALVPASNTQVGFPIAVAERRRRRHGLWFWRKQHGQVVDSLDSLNVSTLHTELQAIDEQIAAALQSIQSLEAGEKEALERRDKLALDVAWHGREAETLKIEQLERRREAVFMSLRRRLEPEVEAWHMRAQQTVSGWRDEDQAQLERIEQALRDVETIAWNLLNREKRRTRERRELIEQVDELLGKAGPLAVTQPEIDWTVPDISVRDITVRLESVLELLRQPGLGPLANVN